MYGKNVVAPLREIQEVKNAIKAYELYSKLNPYSVEDLLKAHGVLMAALTDDAGISDMAESVSLVNRVVSTWLLRLNVFRL